MSAIVDGQTSAFDQNTSSIVIRSFRPDVEGMRAVAIITVFLYHFKLPPFTGGYVGVDVFFVISGFVITQMMLRERSRGKGTSLPDFYARRIRRILPGATVVLVFTAIASFLILGSTSGHNVAIDARDAAIFFANVHFAHSAGNYLLQSAPSSPLLHFWSLSIEEQFYFVWPALFVLIAMLAHSVSHRLKLVCVLAVIAVASYWLSATMTVNNPASAYYSSFVRAGELALGAFVACAMPWLLRVERVTAIICAWLGLAAVLIAAVSFSDSTSFPGTAVLLPTLGTAAVIAFGGVRQRFGPEAVLAYRPVVAVGALSYSLYLWHWPVYAIATERLGHTASWPWRVFLLLVAAILAVSSYQFIENPIRRRGIFVSSRRATYLLALGLLILSIGTTTAISAASNPSAKASFSQKDLGSTKKLSELDRLIIQGTKTKTLPSLVVPPSSLYLEFPAANTPCLIPFTATTAIPGRPVQCAYGDLTSTRLVVLYGDSHATMWLPPLITIAKEEHFKIELVARAACQIADIEMWDYPANAPGVGCYQFHSWAVNYINSLQPAFIIGADNPSAVRYANYLPITVNAYANGLSKTLHELYPSSARFIMISPNPLPNIDPATCLETNSSNIQACTTKYKVAREREFFPAISQGVAKGGGRLIRLDDWFCTKSKCPMVVNHTIVYFDQNHISQHYALQLTNLLKAALAKQGLS